MLRTNLLPKIWVTQSGSKNAAQNSSRSSKAVNIKVDENTSANQKSTYNQVRSNTVNTLKEAIDKHSIESAASRKVEVNTTTTETVLLEEEQTTTRVIENINKSRTLNFVHHQLHQQYLSITYLDKVSFLFSNGYPETLETGGLHNLMPLLLKICKTSAQAKEIHDDILLELCNVLDYQSNPCHKPLRSVANFILMRVVMNVWIRRQR